MVQMSYIFVYLFVCSEEVYLKVSIIIFAEIISARNN